MLECLNVILRPVEMQKLLTCMYVYTPDEINVALLYIYILLLCNIYI